MRNILPIVISFCLLTTSVQGQFLQTIIEIQGETDVSPYEGQEVTFNAMVTEAFGDFWYMQDAYGEWNGILVIGPDVLVPANPPWWTAERQPEVGDELTLTGTVAEVDGNTQIMDVSLIEQTEFWLATPVGIEVDHITSQNEALEGGRVRVYTGTVVVSPDENDEWVLSDGNGEIQCIGLDDEADFNVGDIYDVYGALREYNGVYKIQVSDIDVVAVSVELIVPQVPAVSPNPMTASAHIQSTSPIEHFEVYSSAGELVQGGIVQATQFDLMRGSLAPGLYLLKIWNREGLHIMRVIIQ